MNKHRSFKLEQKARAILYILTGQKCAAQICRELQIGESLLSRCRKQFLDAASSVFEKESGPAQDGERVAELERLVGRLTLELEASKKVSQLLRTSVTKAKKVRSFSPPSGAPRRIGDGAYEERSGPQFDR
jgi:transposase